MFRKKSDCVEKNEEKKIPITMYCCSSIGWPSTAIGNAHRLVANNNHRRNDFVTTTNKRMESSSLQSTRTNRNRNITTVTHLTTSFIYMSLIASICYETSMLMMVGGMIVNTNLPSRTTGVNKPSKPPSTLGHQYNRFHQKSSIHGQTPYGGTSDGEDHSNDQMNDERRLFTYLMRNYDNTIRPVHNASKPINIRLGITLTQIFDLDEKNQVLTTNVWLDQEWIDEFLTWNSTEFGNITKIRIPCQSIWLPDIVLYNNADDYTRGYMNSRAIIEPTGNVFWPPPTKFRSTCQVDVTYFPFDDQTCIMKLGSWIYDGLQVNIENRTQNVDLSNYVSNGEWDLIRTSLVRNVVFYPCCFEPFPDVTITLTIRRKILYYMYNVIVPCIMMSLLTLLVFCLPPESGEKIALGVTVLLAFSVFMLAISEKLPETSESIPLLGVYLTVVMGITSVSIVMTVVVLNFHYCTPLNKRELPEWIKRWIKTDNSTIFDDYFMARSMAGTSTMFSSGCHHHNCEEQSSFSANNEMSSCTAKSKIFMGNNIGTATSAKIYPNVLQVTGDFSQPQQESSTLIHMMKNQHYYHHHHPSHQPTDTSHHTLPPPHHHVHSHHHQDPIIQNREDILYLYGSRTPSAVEDFDSKFNSGNQNSQHQQPQPLLNTIAPMVCAASRLVRRGQVATPSRQESGSFAATNTRRRPLYHRYSAPEEDVPPESNTPPPPPPPAFSRENSNEQSSSKNEANGGVQSNGTQQNLDQEMVQMLRYMMYRQEVDDNISRRIYEWRQLSMYIDRILFWIFTITTLLTSITFLLIIPVNRRGFYPTTTISQN